MNPTWVNILVCLPFSLQCRDMVLVGPHTPWWDPPSIRNGAFLLCSCWHFFEFLYRVITELFRTFLSGVVMTRLQLYNYLRLSLCEPIAILGVNSGFQILSTLFSCAQSSPLYPQDIVATEGT